MIERWEITDRDEWLFRRRANINGSEVAALFGINPYLTPFALYADKTRLADVSAPDNRLLTRGRILESAVPEALQILRPAWKVQKATDYLWSPDWRLGCTPDFYVHCPERGLGVLQAKTVAKPVFEEQWQDGPPQWIVLQTLQEQLLGEVTWGAIYPLVISTYDLEWEHLFEFERHAPAEKRMIAKAASFWADVEAGRQPRMDYDRDADVIKALFPRDNGAVIDLTGDNRLSFLLEERERLLSEIKTAAPAEKDVEAINAEIRAKLGDAATAMLPGWQITNRTQKRKATPETEFRVLRVKRTAGKQEMAA